jgi:predicted dehydrogenase
MPDNITEPLLLIGAGPMAEAYATVLQAIKIPFTVVGRGKNSASSFEAKTGKPVFTGGVQSYLERHKLPSRAIVATGVESLESSTAELIKAGCKKILLEKPGAVNYAGLEKLQQLSIQYNPEIWIAYNRRFYSSVAKAREIINEDGGLRAVYFEFTEWGHVIEPLQKAEGVKQHWFLANSTHVVDLAFHFAGLPEEWKAITSGGAEWHPAATRFVGSGITRKDILFTYQADWEAPGRWGIELLTARRRLILRPMEQLQVQIKGSVAIEPVELENEMDLKYKPGLYEQVNAWLKDESAFACRLDQQLEILPFYYRMANYSNDPGEIKELKATNPLNNIERRNAF